jgi:hypothetical protein
MDTEDTVCPQCGRDGLEDLRAVQSMDVLLANLLQGVFARFTLTPIPGTNTQNAVLEKQIQRFQSLEGGRLVADLLAEAIGLEKLE